jgi:hypothetical protein
MLFLHRSGDFKKSNGGILYEEESYEDFYGFVGVGGFGFLWGVELLCGA